MSLENLIALAGTIAPEAMAPAAAMPPEKKSPYRGHAVVGGVVKFLSVSALEKADASSPTGCLRAWWWRYVGGKKEPDDDGKRHGVEMHARTAHYLRTGDRTILTCDILRGQHMLPDPLDPSRPPDLLIEHELVGVDLTQAILRVDGIPMIGQIDVVHRRGVNKGGSDIENIYDVPGTIEVIDWKFPAKADRAKADRDLPKLIQMAGYATWSFMVAPDAPRVRLSHGVMPSTGQPRKPTILVDRDDIAPTWEHANAVARSIRDAARETDERKVEANTKVCGALQGVRRACQFRTVCSAAGFSSLAHHIGMTQSEMLLDPASLIRPRPEPLPLAPGEHDMGLTILEQIRQQSQPTATQAAPIIDAFNTGVFMQPSATVTLPTNAAPQQFAQPHPFAIPPTGIQPSYGEPAVPQFQPMPAGVVVQGAVATVDLAEMARIKDEEQRAERARARAALIPPGFRETWSAILAYRFGQPAVAGQLAAAYHACSDELQNQPIANGYAGTGPIGERVTCADMPSLSRLLDELKMRAEHHQQQFAAQAALQQQAPQPANSLLPPDAPPSVPHLASTQPAPQPTPVVASPAAAIAGVVAEPAKRTRARKSPPGSTSSTSPTASPAASSPAGQAGASSQATEVEPGAFGLIVVVNAACSADAIDFRPIARWMCEQLATAFGGELKVGSVMLRDLRFAPKDSALGYGKTKAAIQAFVREVFSTGQVQQGLYKLETGGDELLEAAAQGLADVCETTGGLFVRGSL